MAKDVTPPAEDEEKNPVGWPLKYKTVAELDLAIQTYFDECDPHIVKHMEATGFNERSQTMWSTREIMTEQRPYTMTGLARAIGLTRQSLLNYQARDEFFDSIQGAMQRCQEYAERQLFGPYANGAKFNLINNYRREYQPWVDKHEVDHTTKGKPMPLLGGDDASAGRRWNSDRQPAFGRSSGFVSVSASARAALVPARPSPS